MVADTGVGIPVYALPHLFDYFYRYRDESRNAVQGSGIGLAVCREMVQLHHGEIEVQSTEGKGSLFSILLPLGKEHLQPEEIAGDTLVTKFSAPLQFRPESKNAGAALPLLDAAPDADDGRRTILIVEDNADMRALLRHQLGAEYRLKEAKDGSDALRIALMELPDLILSDIMMPGMDGYALCGALLADDRTSHIPILLLTARGGGEDKLKGLEHGAEASFSAYELAQQLGVSRAHLNRKLVALSGLKTNQFIRVIRLQRAAELLRSRAGSVSEIAYAVGFNHLSYFAACFKEQYSCSPSEFSDNQPTDSK